MGTVTMVRVSAGVILRSSLQRWLHRKTRTQHRSLVASEMLDVVHAGSSWAKTSRVSCIIFRCQGGLMVAKVLRVSVSEQKAMQRSCKMEACLLPVGYWRSGL